MKKYFLFLHIFFAGQVLGQEFTKDFFNEFQRYDLEDLDSADLKKFNLEIKKNPLKRDFCLVLNDSFNYSLNGFIADVILDSLQCEIKVVLAPCCCLGEKRVTRYFFDKSGLIKVAEVIISSKLLVPIDDILELSEAFNYNSAFFYNSPSKIDIIKIDECTDEEINTNFIGKLIVESGIIVATFGNSWKLIFAKTSSTDLKETYRIGWVNVEDD